MQLSLLLAKAKKPEVVVAAADMQLSTAALWLTVGSLLVFFALRPELWRRLFMRRVDPRPAALVRILFGITVFWTVADLLMWGRFLFTDEGLYLTDMARDRFGDRLKTVWDAEHGLESIPMTIGLLASKWTVLHIRSDPPFVWGVFGATLGANLAMILGWRTRLMTVLTFFGVMQIYNYSPIWYAGGDTVARTMIFLGLFCRWGEAYSVDTWRRRRRAILGGATTMPALRAIPVWPQRIMMLQIAIIYCSTGLLKSGSTWGVHGTAIYYAMSLDHFYRMPWTGLTTLLQRSGLLMLATWVVHWWESLFPMLLVGLALRDFETSRQPGAPRPWPTSGTRRRRISWLVLAVGGFAFALAARIAIVYYYDVKYLPPALEIGAQALSWLVFSLLLAVPTLAIVGYRWLRRRNPALHRRLLTFLFGKRLWLSMGLMMHLGIEVSMNVGTFVQVMVAIYPAFMSGAEVETVWRYLGSRRRARGELRPTFVERVESWLRPSDAAVTGGRAVGRGWRARPAVIRLADLACRGPVRWVSALVSRTERAPWVVLYAPDESSMRLAATLRCWDVMGRLEFAVNDEVAPGALTVVTPAGLRREGAAAASGLGRIFPGLWALWPVGVIAELLPFPVAGWMRPALGQVSLRLLGQRAR